MSHNLPDMYDAARFARRRRAWTIIIAWTLGCDIFFSGGVWLSDSSLSAFHAIMLFITGAGFGLSLFAAANVLYRGFRTFFRVLREP